MPNSLSIDFTDNPNGIYQPNETVTGQSLKKLSSLNSNNFLLQDLSQLKSTSLSKKLEVSRTLMKEILLLCHCVKGETYDRFPFQGHAHFFVYYRFLISLMILFHNFFPSGLLLSFNGAAYCEWMIAAGGAGGTHRSLKFHGQQSYLDNEVELFGSKESEPVEISVGTHVYTFECLLPENIPSSAEGKRGHIRYKVEATLEIPWAFDIHAKKELKVTRIEDLSKLSADLGSPCEQEEIKVFCCWLFKSDPLIVRMRLPKSGFALGETIPVHVEVINNSSTSVAFTSFTIERVEKCMAQKPSIKERSDTEKLLEKCGAGVKAGESANFDETLEIPLDLDISNDHLCKVFQIMYEVKFLAETGSVSVSPELSMPITIGSLRIGN